MSTALFSALGLLPLACGGAFSGSDDGGSGSTAGGSSAGTSTSGGSKAIGGTKATGGSNGGGTANAGSSSGGTASGGSGTFPCDSPSAAGAGYERCGNGTVHRPSIEKCESKLPRTDAKIAPPNGTGQCTSDADCADRPHGYCSAGGQDPAPVCIYGCVEDSECGENQICVCGELIGSCVTATCKSDSECGDGLRCQSYDASHGCGFVNFACQTREDTCGSDADCANGQYCDGLAGKFSCIAGGCAIGRPFLVEGEERVARLAARTDWLVRCQLDTTASTADERAAASAAWARIGQMEHASVAAFARFALQLLQLGAPPELLERTTRAMADETRHAQLAFGVASALGGAAIGPAALDIERSLLETSLVDVTRLVVREGCIGETIAALEAREAAARATEPAITAMLGRIADDESEHAELAWRFVAWALDRAPQQIAPLLDAELSLASAHGASKPSTSADELDLTAWGILPASVRAEVERAAFREIIEPCGRAVLAQSGKPAEFQAVSA